MTPIKGQNIIWKKLQSIFVPRYSETSVFLIALSFLLLVIWDVELNHSVGAFLNEAVNVSSDARSTYHGKERSWSFMVALLFTSGFVLSIYHSFSQKPKSSIEKTIMVFFALSLNGVSGIIAGIQVLESYHGFLVVFPVFNLLSGLVLLYIMGFVDIHALMEDANAPLNELFLGAFVTVITFIVCQYRFGLHWSITFSICVTYAMIANDMVGSLLFRTRQDVV